MYDISFTVIPRRKRILGKIKIVTTYEVAAIINDGSEVRYRLIYPCKTKRKASLVYVVAQIMYTIFEDIIKAGDNA